MAGCRLPWRDGPISKELVRSREFSRQGVAAMESGRWDEADALLAKAVEACPEDCDARRHYAEALWRHGDQQKAIAQLQRVVAEPNPDPAVHVRLAEMYLTRNQLEPASRQIEAALDAEPQLAIAWAMRGRLLRAAGRPQEALTAFHRAIGYAPEERTFLLETAEIYRQLNKPDKALSILHSLADSYGPGEEPQEVPQLEGLALAALGRYDEAVQRFSEALARGQPTPELLYRLAESHWHLGHQREATMVAQQALALAPNHRPSLELLGWLDVADRGAGPAR
ncbi:MAG: tetratricopeptide repeat protein [Pirellulales bacterium]|nr:tetratricopeptide repeat protein [Pirellulales bacterium]